MKVHPDLEVARQPERDFAVLSRILRLQTTMEVPPTSCSVRNRQQTESADHEDVLVDLLVEDNFI